MIEKNKITSLVRYDRAQNCKLVAGIDEAGRGPLFGPVTVASCIMPLDDDNIIEGINDSKKLTAKKRDKLYDEIISKAICYHVAMIDNNRIDQINILEATKEGMRECVDSLSVKPNIVLIDAVKVDCDIPTISIIKGDATSYNIACASILAKVSRDRYIDSIADSYSQYNISKNKGYPTKEHTQAVKKYGPSPLHRKSFLKNIDKW